MYSVYAIYNRDHNKIYIGQTEDLIIRLDLHNTHKFKGYTSRYTGLWVIIYSEQVKSRNEALIREKQLKSFRGRDFIRKHIPV